MCIVLHIVLNMDRSNSIISLVNKVEDGSDYDVAKLFIHVFPDSSTYTDKEISVKLSEDVHDLILEQVKLLSQKMYDLSRAFDTNTNSAYSEYDFIQAKKERYEEKLKALRTHKHKQQFIAEIKAIR